MALVARRPVYEKLGVQRIVNGVGTVTRYGGSIMPPEVVEAMVEASRSYVDLDELQRKAGEVVARCTGAEAGYVCNGAAAGLVLGTAACVAGSDPAKISRLPDTTGMKNEVIMHRSQRNGYDHSIRSVGVKIVEIGFANATAAWELEAAIGPATAAVAYVVSSWLHPSAALPLDEVIKIAHQRGVPVLVDAAAALPPPENLTRFIELGADLVTFSGGKGIRGPQASGVLCGRRDLIEASLVQGNPNHAIGRPMKVGKEEMVGLATALELYVQRDHRADFAGWVAKAESIADSLKGIAGIYAREVHNDRWWVPTLIVSFENRWLGRSPADIAQALRVGDPPIYLTSQTNELIVAMMTLEAGDAELVARRLREELVR
jgi:D-glucosaminate-6-phosphate ammonia-lyase